MSLIKLSSTSKNSSQPPSQPRNYKTLPTITTELTNSRTWSKMQQALTSSLAICLRCRRCNCCRKNTSRIIWSRKPSNTITSRLHSTHKSCRKRLKMIYNFTNWQTKLTSLRNSRRSTKAPRNCVMSGMTSGQSFNRYLNKHKSCRPLLETWKPNTRSTLIRSGRL